MTCNRDLWGDCSGVQLDRWQDYCPVERIEGEKKMLGETTLPVHPKQKYSVFVLFWDWIQIQGLMHPGQVLYHWAVLGAPDLIPVCKSQAGFKHTQLRIWNRKPRKEVPSSVTTGLEHAKGIIRTNRPLIAVSQLTCCCLWRRWEGGCGLLIKVCRLADTWEHCHVLWHMVTHISNLKDRN